MGAKRKASTTMAVHEIPGLRSGITLPQTAYPPDLSPAQCRVWISKNPCTGGELPCF